MPRLNEVMTSEVFVTPPSARLADVAASMLRGRFGSAVVMEGSMLLGILTERDVPAQPRRVPTSPPPRSPSG